MNKKKELAKNTIIIFAGKVCTQLISFLLLPLYTSYLLTEEYGFVDLITTYVTLIVPIITMELEMSVFRYLVDCRKDKKETKRVFSNNFIILLSSLFIFIIGYFIVTCFWKFDYRFLILFDIVICTFSGNFLQIARGVGRTLDYAISCIITGVSTILFNILLIVVFQLGAFGMITSMAVANGLGALYLFIRLKMWQYIDFKKKDKKLIREMYKYSVPLVPNGISWWIVNVSDRTIITAILGAAAGGAASAVGGALDIYYNDKLRNEALDYTKDQFGYQLGNIKALPQSLSRTTAFTNNNKYFPVLEYYTCTDIEKQALRDKIKYNGMTVMRIGRMQDFLQNEKTYIKGRLIRLEGINDDYHLLTGIADEIYKGVFI